MIKEKEPNFPLKSANGDISSSSSKDWQDSSRTAKNIIPIRKTKRSCVFLDGDDSQFRRDNFQLVHDVEMAARLTDKIAKFNSKADDHVKKQAVNPFSNDSVKSTSKRQFADDEYGRPVKGSKSEGRGFRASALVYKEMLELCEIINDYGVSVDEDDPRKVISFGDLFSMYTTISNKLVGILLRTRKHKIIDFEGEVLFQRRDDDVPVVLLKPIEEIREEFHREIDTTLSAIEENRKAQELLLESTQSDDSD